MLSVVSQRGGCPGDVGAWQEEVCARPQALACHDRAVVPALGVGSGGAARRRGPVERELVKKQQQRKLKERRDTGGWRWGTGQLAVVLKLLWASAPLVSDSRRSNTDFQFPPVSDLGNQHFPAS